MLTSPLVGKWSMSGYVKVVRGYGASFRIADCLNAPLMMTRQMSLVRYLGIDSFLTDTPMKSGYGPLLSHWHTISRFQLLYEAQVLILLGRCLRSAEYVYPVRISMTTIAKSHGTDQAVSCCCFNHSGQPETDTGTADGSPCPRSGSLNYSTS